MDSENATNSPELLYFQPQHLTPQIHSPDTNLPCIDRDKLARLHTTEQRLQLLHWLTQHLG